MGLAVDWYAANPSFHPIPPGYGLPFGRAEEEFIPNSLVQEAEFALAREQLKTQTPPVPQSPAGASHVAPAAKTAKTEQPTRTPPQTPVGTGVAADAAPAAGAMPPPLAGAPLPPDWPDPAGFIPLPPSPERPPPRPQLEPVMTHTRVYHGQDAKFTERLATYYYLRDDARFGGWPAYLERPGDFVRFCCYLHVTETLAARGGTGDARVLWRWPIRRYER
jgi:hypothetical protein